MGMDDWIHFQTISLNPDGTLQKVRCKYCNWGGPRGVSANATGCRRHLQEKHATVPGFVVAPGQEADVEEEGSPGSATVEEAAAASSSVSLSAGCVQLNVLHALGILACAC